MATQRNQTPLVGEAPMMVRFSLVAVCLVAAVSFSPDPLLAMTTGEFMTTPQIREAIDGKALRLKDTIYGFFENGRARVSKGYGQRTTTWTAEAGRVCLADQSQPDPICARLWKENLSGKIEVIFNGRPTERYEVTVKGIGNGGFDAAVEEMSQELLKGSDLTDAQRQAILAGQARYRTGFSDPPIALGEAYRKYITIKKCYDARAEYEYVYVTDSDLDSSKSNIIKIEKYAQSIMPGLNTQAVWDDVIAHPEKYTSIEWFYYVTINNSDPETEYAAIRTACQGLVSFLANTYKKIDPKAGLPQKDF